MPHARYRFRPLLHPHAGLCRSAAGPYLAEILAGFATDPPCGRPPRGGTTLVCRQHQPGRAPQGGRLHDCQNPLRPPGSGMGCGADFGLDAADRPVHTQRAVSAMDGNRLDATSSAGGGIHANQRSAGVTVFAVHDFCAGATLRLQQNDPGPVAARHGEIARFRRRYWSAFADFVFVVDGRDGAPMVAVDMGGLDGLQPAGHGDLPDMDRALVQPL